MQIVDKKIILRGISMKAFGCCEHDPVLRHNDDHVSSFLHKVSQTHKKKKAIKNSETAWLKNVFESKAYLEN